MDESQYDYIDLNNANPSVDEVRVWGYDPLMIFMEQDEDLILHQAELVPILMELSADDECPKREYCFSILCFYTQWLFCHRNTIEIEEVYLNILKYGGPMNEVLKNWRDDFLYHRELLNKPRPISDNEADMIASALSSGKRLSSKIERLPKMRENYIQYQVTSGYLHYFYINPDTGIWKTSKFEPLSDGELKN
jgi:hypothetical protein